MVHKSVCTCEICSLASVGVVDWWLWVAWQTPSMAVNYRVCRQPPHTSPVTTTHSLLKQFTTMPLVLLICWELLCVVDINVYVIQSMYKWREGAYPQQLQRVSC